MEVASAGCHGAGQIDVDVEGGVAGHEFGCPPAKAAPPPGESRPARCLWVRLQRAIWLCRRPSDVHRKGASTLWARTAISRLICS